ncbi:MAG TPA: hypothetical protein ENI87_09200 [bacterium]|nr:hypothetical protein [bacterium]
MDRRRFVAGVAAAGGAACAAAGVGRPGPPAVASGRVNFTRDGLDLSPVEQAALLGELAAASDFAVDSYSRGGVVEQLERKFARELGKEAAVFVPTGTMANHMALRRLCKRGNGRRVAVQAESHVFRDAGDGAQELSGLHLLPLGEERPGFPAADLRRALDRTAAGRVRTKIAAVAIETPVRRCHDRRFSPGDLDEVIALARDRGLGLHLDGARLHIEAAFGGRSVREAAAPFDTVYVSLYKAFHAPSGAILAGPADLLEGLYHERRMFGGGMPQVWPFAAIALSFLDGTVERLRRAITRADEVFARLAGRGVRVERFPDGTNVALLHAGSDAAPMRERALRAGVVLPVPDASGTFAIKINESLLRKDADAIAAGLLEGGVR